MFRDRRGEPGVATGLGSLADGTWATGFATGEGASIPQQIADKLRGRSFSNWKGFRRAFWKLAGHDELLAKQFSEENISKMRNGRAPFARKRDAVGGRKVLELHHKVLISRNGGVFDLDNISVTTPKLHI